MYEQDLVDNADEEFFLRTRAESDWDVDREFEGGQYHYFAFKESSINGESKCVFLHPDGTIQDEVLMDGTWDELAAAEEAIESYNAELHGIQDKNLYHPATGTRLW